MAVHQGHVGRASAESSKCLLRAGRGGQMELATAERDLEHPAHGLAVVDGQQFGSHLMNEPFEFRPGAIIPARTKTVKISAGAARRAPFVYES